MRRVVFIWGCPMRAVLWKQPRTMWLRRHFWMDVTAFTLVTMCVMCAVVVRGADLVTPCESGGDRPFIVLVTEEGEISIELLPEAAPAAVERLVHLVEGPIFLPELSQPGPERERVGYYDGLVFDEALRGGFVSTALRPPARAVLIETEVDADALGLDQQKITAHDEAMSVWQHELMPYQNSLPDDSLVPPRLMEWLQTWSTTFDIEFLIGVSRKEINEVLGYRYRTGLDSLPVTRGAVSLEPFSPQWSTPRLTIALKRISDQDGRRMVIGRVVEGLEIADLISTRRLSPHKAVQHRPLVPVKIFKTRFECRVVEPEKPEAEGVN